MATAGRGAPLHGPHDTWWDRIVHCLIAGPQCKQWERDTLATDKRGAHDPSGFQMGSILPCLFSRIALLSSFILSFYCLPTHTPGGTIQFGRCCSRGTEQYIGTLVAIPPLCSGPYIWLSHLQYHWIVGFLRGSRASASIKSGRQETPGTSNGGTSTTLDGGILSCGGICIDGAVLCAPISDMAVFCRCMVSLISVTAREATAI
jgi:hypothetical protein